MVSRYTANYMHFDVFLLYMLTSYKLVFLFRQEVHIMALDW
jgi:hypothetical protein